MNPVKIQQKPQQNKTQQDPCIFHGTYCTENWNPHDANFIITGGMAGYEPIYEDIGARSRYLKQGQVIASHRILWDAITYSCLGYLLLAWKSLLCMVPPSDY